MSTLDAVSVSTLTKLMQLVEEAGTLERGELEFAAQFPEIVQDALRALKHVHGAYLIALKGGRNGLYMVEKIRQVAVLMDLVNNAPSDIAVAAANRIARISIGYAGNWKFCQLVCQNAAERPAVARAVLRHIADTTLTGFAWKLPTAYPPDCSPVTKEIVARLATEEMQRRGCTS